MNKEKLVDRINKLFALAGNNSNKHKAESALLMARKLLDKYNISERELSVEDVVGITIETSVNMPWIRTVYREISRLYDVEYILDSSATPNAHLFIGNYGNRITSKIVRQYVIDIIRSEGHGKGNGFRNFAAMAIKAKVNVIMSKRMKEATGTGLVVVSASRQFKKENDSFINKFIGKVITKTFLL